MKWFPLLAGIIACLAGFYLFTNPLVTVATVGWFLALFVLISGITGLMAYFTTDKEYRNLWFLVQNILSIVFGFILLSSSAFSLSGAVITILAYWVLLSGLLRLFGGLQLRRLGFPGAGTSLGSAIIAIIFGLVLLGQPILTAAIIGRFVGLLFIAIGISSIYTFFTLR